MDHHTTPDVIDLPLDQIRTDGQTQIRIELSQETYLDYRDKWLSDVDFDPLDVFHDGSTYWLADGFHRFYGAREAKLATIKARVRQGTRRDAILFACGANAAHGLRRTNEDKRNAVKVLLADTEWVKWSDRRIADAAGVGPDLVGSIRKQLSFTDSSESAPRVGRDGKKRKALTRRQRDARNYKRTIDRHKKAEVKPAAVEDEDDDLSWRNDHVEGFVETPLVSTSKAEGQDSGGSSHNVLVQGVSILDLSPPKRHQSWRGFVFATVNTLRGNTNKKLNAACRDALLEMADRLDQIRAMVNAKRAASKEASR